LIIGAIPSEHLHLGEVGIAGSQLITSGLYGWTAVVTGTGTTVQEAKDQAYQHARRVGAPNLRYRLDIGDALISGDLAKLVEWDWIRAQ
jgi:phosphoribosylamine--glycine ligase